MPEVADKYIGSEILLPRRNQMTRYHVVEKSHDVMRNDLGRVHANPNLNTRFHQVEFNKNKIKG